MSAMSESNNIHQFHALPSNGSLLPTNQQQHQQQHQHQQSLGGSISGASAQSQVTGPHGPPLLSAINSTYPSANPGTSTSNLLVLGNIPTDLSKREAALIFSLVIDEVLGIEVKDYKIYVYFKNGNTCLTTSKLIDGKFIFGNEYPPVKVEYDSSSSVLSSPQNIHNTPNAFNSLRLSNANISPPNLNHPQLHHQSSNPSLGPVGVNGQQQIVGGPSGPTGTSGTSVPFDNFQKRQSIGNQRSRFVFSDPFSSGSATGSAPGAVSNTSVPPPASGSGTIDLTDLSGKSILLMESHNDAREYQNLVRDPWGSNSSASAKAPPSGVPLGSNPQTPGVNVTTPFEWTNSSSNPANASSNNNNNTSSSNSSGSNPQNGSISATSGSSVSGSVSASADRRRTSSAFFTSTGTSNQATIHGLTTSQAPQTSALVGGQQPSVAPQTTASLLTHQTPASAPQGPTAAGLLASQTPQSQVQSQQVQQAQQPQQSQQSVALSGSSVASSATSQVSQAAKLPVTSQSSQAQQLSQQLPAPQQQSQQSQQSQPGATTPRSTALAGSKDVPDLSLLARVPPPANPADQNPPCNTLYVGNLPPDATEAELRALFSPQKGFRRLSFRTKNQPSGTSGTSGTSGHNHGPMCFVEFEDVAHATRALAELYGRALPRPNGGNGKGGIRLSFSKNPLGVRGPGNPRRTSTNQIGGATTSTTTGQVSSGNGNSVGNYGYSNYHQK